MNIYGINFKMTTKYLTIFIKIEHYLNIDGERKWNCFKFSKMAPAKLIGMFIFFILGTKLHLLEMSYTPSAGFMINGYPIQHIIVQIYWGFPAFANKSGFSYCRQFIHQKTTLI
jgi:hypothetical protein